MADNNPHPSANITFVQADPSTFRDVVQRLTGDPTRPTPEVGTRRPSFKLHERRQSARKLEIQLSSTGFGFGSGSGSPVSTLDLFEGGSPRTPTSLSAAEEEERAIAGKGFYLHPSPRTTRGPDPELLPLFPVHSHRVDPSVSLS